MPILANIALIGWIPICVLLFAVLPPRRAILAAFTAGWLLLPMTTLSFPGMPDFGKLTSISLGVLLGILIFDRRRLFSWRPGWVDVPLALWCMIPIATSISNGLGVYDGLSASWSNTTNWGLPVVFGRVYLARRSDLCELAVAFVIGALAYVPLCLFEVRVSPQLHAWVYGFFQHSFLQTMRYGGYRPVVFLQNGLAVSVLMGSATIAAVWLWRSRAVLKVGGLAMVFVVPMLAAMTVLCKSFTGILLLLIGVTVFFARRMVSPRFALALLVFFPPTYILLRATEIVPAVALVDLVEVVDRDRAGSLGARLRQEDLFTDHTWSRPLLGWGGWMRNFPRDDRGRLATRGVDAFWLLTLSKNGIIGLSLIIIILLTGPTLFLLRFSPAMWTTPVLAPVAALALLLALHMIDNLANALTNPAFLLMAGGLTSFGLHAPQWKRAELAAAAAAWRNQ